MTDLILDHVLIAVRDLDAAKDTFERLGFKVTPEGKHPGRGTSNRLVVFGGEYLELISVHDPEGDLFRPNLPSFLDAREGLFIFSMGTSDVHERVRSVRSAGVLITDPVKGSRQAGDGMTAYSWTQAEVDPEEMPGSQTFFIQHDHTIEERYTEPPDPTNHPNGVLGCPPCRLLSRTQMPRLGAGLKPLASNGCRKRRRALLTRRAHACDSGTVPWTSASRRDGTSWPLHRVGVRDRTG